MTSEDGSAQVVEEEVKESLALRIGNWLLANKTKWQVFPGYSGSGVRAYDETETFCTLGDLNESHPVALRRRSSFVTHIRFFGLRIWSTRHVMEQFIGVIAPASELMWSLKVYGRDQVDFCRKIAEDLKKDFKVTINVRLVEEKAR